MPKPDGHVMMTKVEKNGETWCPLKQGASYLKTTIPKIRGLIGSGDLRCTQIRRNGAIYVNVTDLVRLRKARLYGAGQAE